MERGREREIKYIICKKSTIKFHGFSKQKRIKLFFPVNSTLKQNVNLLPQQDLSTNEALCEAVLCHLSP